MDIRMVLILLIASFFTPVIGCKSNFDCDQGQHCCKSTKMCCGSPKECCDGRKYCKPGQACRRSPHPRKDALNVSTILIVVFVTIGVVCLIIACHVACKGQLKRGASERTMDGGSNRHYCEGERGDDGC